MTGDPIRILLCDDHPLFLDGLKAGLEQFDDLEVINAVGTTQDAISLVEEAIPDVVLMDIRMASPTGIEATSQIKQLLPSANVVMLTASEEESDLYASIRAGASGYLLKGSSAEEIADAVRGAAAGFSPISPSMASQLLTEFAELSKKSPEPKKSGLALSDREIEVLKLVAKGMSNKQIGEELGISENTAKKHIRNILDKLHLKSRVEAALHAVREGLVKP